METVWRYTFDTELGIDPKNRAVLMSEAPRNPKLHRERMTQVFKVVSRFREMWMWMHSDAVITYAIVKQLLAIHVNRR